MAELEGKVAVITGAGSGMARASAEVFVREGAKVLAADISGRQDDTAEALGDAVVPFRVDVTDEASVEAMFAAALAAFGKVDAVLNVAGIGDASPLADTSLEDYERIMAVDLKGVMLGTKHGIRTMVPTGGGAIINWSSTGGMNGSRLPTSVYSAIGWRRTIHPCTRRSASASRRYPATSRVPNSGSATLRRADVPRVR
jgi:NAD(P)-dependent dehydrogenase (short-subunit alcohol dehydrogenase family)